MVTVMGSGRAELGPFLRWLFRRPCPFCWEFLGKVLPTPHVWVCPKMRTPFGWYIKGNQEQGVALFYDWLPPLNGKTPLCPHRATTTEPLGKGRSDQCAARSPEPIARCGALVPRSTSCQGLRGKQLAQEMGVPEKGGGRMSQLPSGGV